MIRALLALSALALLAAACGPYTTDADRTATTGGVLQRSGRVVAASDCAGTPGAPPSPDPAQTGATSIAAVDAATSATASVTAGACDLTPVPAVTRTPATTPPAAATVSSTAVPTLGSTATPTPQPTPLATGTSAAATATARASGQVAYLSFGDGLQWGCCGALGSSSPSLFRDYLEQRLGRPVIWQTSGSGYETTDTFITRPGGGEPQLEFALTLIDYYRREGIPVVAVTMSIGGNNLVDIGRSCAAPPCIDAFAAGLQHLRDQLHLIYAPISAALDPSTPLFVLLYYDANECPANATSGAAIDAWNAVIAEVAAQYGAHLVDARALFRGHCDWIDPNGLDANAAGHAAIAQAYARAFASLPGPAQ